MTEAPDRFADLPRATLQLACIAAVIAASLWILQPFLGALVWAVVIVVSTWGPFLRLSALLGNRRGFAVAAMSLALLSVLVLPLYFSISTIVDNKERIVAWSSSFGTFEIPRPPGWLENIPLVGSRVSNRWSEFAAESPEERSARLSPFAATGAAWVASRVGGLGLMLVHFLVTVVIAAILYANGEEAARSVELFSSRIGGASGVEATRLAASAVRAVAVGVVVTAALQSLLAGLGLFIAGIPLAAVLTAVMFLLGIAQLGPGLVMFPATVWVYHESGFGWGTGLLIWSIFCGTFDNVLRSILIKRGADIPLSLIFAGVIGGLFAFGVVGLFVGPSVLAVAYALLTRWIEEERIEVAPTAATNGGP